MGKRLNELRKRVKQLERQIGELQRAVGNAKGGKRLKKGMKAKSAPKKHKVVRTATRGKSAVRPRSLPMTRAAPAPTQVHPATAV